MRETKLSCGLLVLNELGELLIGHSTGNSIWDLPKGLMDEGETPQNCALREAREEFGLQFEPERLTDLGRYAYYRGKDLHLFWVQTTTHETCLVDLRCTSYFVHPVSGQTLPEIDGFAWADKSQLQRRLGKSMQVLLLDKGILDLCAKQQRPPGPLYLNQPGMTVLAAVERGNEVNRHQVAGVK